MDKINLTVLHIKVYLILNFNKYAAVGEKETTVIQTCTDFVLLVVRISVLCIGIPEIDL